MITGTVLNRRAWVSLRLLSPYGPHVDIDFVLDSGFTGVTTLAPDTCRTLGLPFLRVQHAGLADGSPVLLEVHEATLLWDGRERDVEVLALEGAPLIGMTLLEEFDVRFQARNGGLVSIEPL